ncbi:hypothetical protein TNIN_386291 [Trichonephila inaurata madagascariensis]|uniref:Uncharacterized protein n=1 Tax=Trichonephila inaurata madagascariensis TaxID=2747483 RepID=A0A8X6XB66_9ARAC|nr:hypothetical protein TNIN_386291 [Trichonephila inaurata madagascariensis]
MVSKTLLARCHRQHNLPAKNAAISAIFLPSFDFSSETHQHTNQTFIEDFCLLSPVASFRPEEKMGNSKDFVAYVLKRIVRAMHLSSYYSEY